VKSEVHHTNPLSIRTEYLSNSSAAGVLYGFYHVAENGIDFTKSAFLALSRNNSLNYELTHHPPTGVYFVHTYQIEYDGLLSIGEVFPATSQVFSGTGNSRSMYTCTAP
jgi:hypothetical protein